MVEERGGLTVVCRVECIWLRGPFFKYLQNSSHLPTKPSSPEQARDYAEKMLGNSLITKQTGAQGRVCNAVRFAFTYLSMGLNSFVGHASRTKTACTRILCCSSE